MVDVNIDQVNTMSIENQDNNSTTLCLKIETFFEKMNPQEREEFMRVIDVNPDRTFFEVGDISRLLQRIPQHPLTH